jgi:undecaprenyl-phosphate 4-deoxy-4-formamido-L-arabinose transferase
MDDSTALQAPRIAGEPGDSPSGGLADLADGVSVVVPVFNSEQSLPVLVEQLVDLLEQRGESYEIVLVNDGSRDASWEVIQKLAKRFPRVAGINLMRNYGQHNALLCGIRLARYRVIVTMDDDLQHPPAEVPKLLDKLAEGYDVIYGSPLELPHGLWRNLASRITKIALQSAMGAETARWVSAFRAFRTVVRDAFADYQGPYVSIDVLLTWGTTRFTHVNVRHEPRRLGVTNYTFGKLVTHALNMITGFSTLPLQVASVLGFLLTLFGVLVLLYIVGRFFLEGGAPPGFPFLASIIAIFSGAQLFALGMIGEYLARIHFRLMQRPAYVVRSETGQLTREE